MTPMRETLPQIAAIVAVPVVVIDWFASRARRTAKPVVDKGGTAIDFVP